MSKQRIFSGVAPSGNIHIGNYLGAIKNWVKLQDECDSIFCVVDMHAITLPRDPEELRKKTIEVAKIYLASGIDLEKSTLFIQSHIPEHAELSWILNTIARTGEMSRMTQFKDKAELHSGNSSTMESVPLGIFNYPVLMAADILLYDTQVVPVGKDQLQHIEITRTLANRFNKRFGNTFIVPEPYITKEGANIMGLDDPTKKMSKSAKSDYNYIALNDSEEDVRRKIKKAVTDSGSEIVYRDDKPALMNLINIYSLLSDKPAKEIEKQYKGKGYAEFKTDLAEVIIKFMNPFQEKMNDLSDEKVLEILREGAEKVRPIAKNKLDEVKKKIGFVL
ncbi:MAG TPA: tryptophan--tRNA ligase [Candidatus Moranbacteria bacterium]|nr:tryptophan--tRNA ligase [Candidatus Moranbacteria bacterium]